MKQNAVKFFEERGLLEWCSAPEELGQVFESETVTAYIGFDPTADSLHVGHLIPIMGLAWLQRLGHRPIAIAGAGTGLIGDPSGKSKERNLITLEQMEKNLQGVHPQLAHFLDFDCGATSARIINNYDWLGKLSLLDFLRDIGKYFPMNYLVNKEYVRSRLDDPDKSISFTEFTYTLLQAYDFLHLFEAEGCKLQMGGNDQQGNIVSGIDLIRKKTGGEAFGITYPLLLTSSGQKFGKTEGGAVWLDPKRTSPYKFYQFWVNAEDRDVERLLRLFTFLPLEEIRDIAARHGAAPERREAQKILAEEITRTVHGEKALAGAVRATEILFGGKFDLEDLIPDMLATLEAEVPGGEAPRDERSVVELLVASGACASKGEAKRLIQGGGVSLNGRKVESDAATVEPDEILFGSYLFFRLGKRRFHMVRAR